MLASLRFSSSNCATVNVTGSVGKPICRYNPVHRRRKASRFTSLSALAHSKTALEYHFGNRHDQKDAADDGIEPEKGRLDPVEAAPARDPMFENQTANNDEPAYQIGNFEA